MGLFDILPKGSQVKCWDSTMRSIKVGDFVCPLIKKSHIIILQEGGFVNVNSKGKIITIVEDGIHYNYDDFIYPCFDKWGNKWSTESYKVNKNVPVYEGQLKSEKE
jgi:hypothetical protein